jgi:hypothetical protein
LASLPTLSDGIALTDFIVAEDVERAAHFYSNVLGGEIVLAGEPTIVALANLKAEPPVRSGSEAVAPDGLMVCTLHTGAAARRRRASGGP